jgi:V/A-type H+-transporting ATPase subunit A
MQQTIAQNWKAEVVKMKDRLFKGHEAMEQISILGDDNVPIDYHEIFWKSELIDFVILQQDAFDSVDGFTSLERLKYMQVKIAEICEASFRFSAYEEVGIYFRAIINIWKQINYAEFQSEEFKNFNRQLDAILNERKQTNGNVTV